ncbi:hypothetical protein K8I31_19175, partial [bacterium]|nr:hypothetical protein [bacterium]
NGDYAVDAQIKPGQDGKQNFGINIDTGPASNTLENGVHFQNIVKTSNGYQQFVGGIDDNGITSTMNSGVQNATDFAVSLAYFTERNVGLTNGTGLNATGDTIANGFFNGVSVFRTDVISFEGVLSDGKTKYYGAISAFHQATGVTFAGFASAISVAIDNAESSLFGGSANVPSSFQTSVEAETTGSNAGRILLRSNGESVNLSDLSIRVVRNGEMVSQATGVSRSGEIGASSVLAGQGQIGNSVTAITGSTFGTGDFEISIEDVQGAQNRQLESTVAFRDHNGNIINRSTSLTHNTAGLMLNGSFVDGVYTGGVSVSTGDTITMRGIEADGTTFETIYTFSNDSTTDSSLTDFTFSSVSGLIAELNYRTRFYGAGNANNGDLTRFESGIFTFSPSGVLQLIDDLGRDNSQLDFTLTFNDSDSSTTTPYTISDDAELVKEGFAESATFRLNGGDAFRAKAGDMVTAYGAETTREGEVQPQLTFRVGTNLTIGTDRIIVEGQEFVGSLNGGPKVTFQNGAQDVVFIDDGSFNTGVAKILQVDFDGILDITSTSATIPDPRYDGSDFCCE